MSSNDKVGIRIANHKTLKERVAAASECCGALHLNMPLLVDDIDDKVGEAYSAFPDRLYLIDRAGKVVYKGGRGPFGMQPAELEQSILMLLADEAKLYPNSKPEQKQQPNSTTTNPEQSAPVEKKQQPASTTKPEPVQTPDKTVGADTK